MPKYDLTINVECKCGDDMKVSSTPSTVALYMVRKFWEKHQGSGHAGVEKKKSILDKIFGA